MAARFFSMPIKYRLSFPLMPKTCCNCTALPLLELLLGSAPSNMAFTFLMSCKNGFGECIGLKCMKMANSNLSLFPNNTYHVIERGNK